MKVFISWSGERSKAVAIELKTFLKRVIQALDPWISTDIEKGARWSDEIASALEQVSIGIICLTPENLSSPWINFEAGAIAKMRGAQPCTLLLDLEKSEVKPPLGQFQHTRIDRSEMLDLLKVINRVLGESGGKMLSDSFLGDYFDAFWPKFEKAISAIPAPTSPIPPKRDLHDMVGELLEMVRELRRSEPAAIAGSEYNAQLRDRSLRIGYATLSEPDRARLDAVIKLLTESGYIPPLVSAAPIPKLAVHGPTISTALVARMTDLGVHL